jgi:hypothetical protein
MRRGVRVVRGIPKSSSHGSNEDSDQREHTEERTGRSKELGEILIKLNYEVQEWSILSGQIIQSVIVYLTCSLWLLSSCVCLTKGCCGYGYIYYATTRKLFIRRGLVISPTRVLVYVLNRCLGQGNLE